MIFFKKNKSSVVSTYLHLICQLSSSNLREIELCIFFGLVNEISHNLHVIFHFCILGVTFSCVNTRGRCDDDGK